MKISLPSLFGGVLLLLASTAVAAAPLPPGFLAPLSGDDLGAKPPAFLFTPAASAASSGDDCGLPMYSCQSCISLITPVKLCSEVICGNHVIISCEACAMTCHLPPG